MASLRSLFAHFASVLGATAFVVAILGAGALLATTSAQAASPWWHLTSGARPTLLSSAPKARGEIIDFVSNLGDATVSSAVSPIVIEDTLPAGLELGSVEAIAGGPGPEARGAVVCRKEPGNLAKCILEGTFQNAKEEVEPKSLPPYDLIEVRIKVKTKAGAQSGEVNEVAVSGGGVAAATLSRPLTFTQAPIPFGVENYELPPELEGGGTATQAGSHPFQFTTQIAVNQDAATPEPIYEAHPVALAKDVRFKWPAGLLGNPSPLPQCTLGQFLTTVTEPSGGNANECPSDTAAGVAMVTLDEPFDVHLATLTVPIFNVEPAAGEPARFGFEAEGVPVLIDPSLRSGNGGDYGITVATTNISQSVAFLSTQAIVWGVPGDPSHDNSRGWGCIAESRGLTHFPCLGSEEAHPPAFITLPTQCTGAPLSTTAEVDSWLDPTLALTAPSSPPMPTLDGCNRLPFAPTIQSEPTSNAATSPTGLNFDLDFNDEGLVNGKGLAQSQMKRAVVTLPEGFTANPSLAEGLKACSLAEYEAADIEPLSGCTPESKVGEVEIESPLVAGKKVPGGLFVARQGENPYGNLLTIYLIARNPELGVFVKQALKVTPNPITGQLVTEVDNVPQLPFSRFHLGFRQGQRSPLITPPACGEYTVKADLYPYSNPGSPVQQSSSFKITQGPEGLGCPSGGLPPFHPGLEAGTMNNAAGTYSPFYTHITRKDSEQEITRFSIKLPTGVIAKLAGVAECPDVQIAAAKAREREGGAAEEIAHPSCPASSEVGHTLVGAGVGNVLAYAGGRLYLGGPYKGSPLSLVSISDAKVGPFDLGTVVVRFAIDINHETAEVSIDGANSDPIPHIVDGIPIHLRDLRAYVDRKDFTLNPTSCAKKSTASTILGSGLNFVSSSDDVPVTVSSPFQAADCASLGFKPKLALNLVGKKTRRGALPALKAVLTYPKGGAYANVAKAQVTLPGSEFLEQGHLKDVCTRKEFEAGKVFGEKCPAKSIYGRASAVTPLLSKPLEGPVYLRTGYGTRLPELAVALNGPQINIDLAGRIDSVHQKGSEESLIRNSFEMVPDAPVEKFVLELKGGKKGLLVNSTDVCQGTHKALAAFTGQNGKLDEYEPVVQAQCGRGKKQRSKDKKEGSK